MIIDSINTYLTFYFPYYITSIFLIIESIVVFFLSIFQRTNQANLSSSNKIYSFWGISLYQLSIFFDMMISIILFTIGIEIIFHPSYNVDAIIPLIFLFNTVIKKIGFMIVYKNYNLNSIDV